MQRTKRNALRRKSVRRALPSLRLHRKARRKVHRTLVLRLLHRTIRAAAEDTKRARTGRKGEALHPNRRQETTGEKKGATRTEIQEETEAGIRRGEEAVARKSAGGKRKEKSVREAGTRIVMTGERTVRGAESGIMEGGVVRGAEIDTVTDVEQCY